MDLSMGKQETGLACMKKQGTKKSDNYYDGGAACGQGFEPPFLNMSSERVQNYSTGDQEKDKDHYAAHSSTGNHSDTNAKDTCHT